MRLIADDIAGAQGAAGVRAGRDHNVEVVCAHGGCHARSVGDDDRV